MAKTFTHVGELQLDDLVVVTAEHPCGSEMNTQGEVGIITEIDKPCPDAETQYKVKTMRDRKGEGFVYLAKELRFLSETEAISLLKTIMRTM